MSKRIIEGIELSSIAVRFGSVHSTISMPYHMSHASSPEALRDRLAPPSDLIRVSVGIEDVVDILEELEEAIDKAYRGLGISINSHERARLGSALPREYERTRENKR